MCSVLETNCLSKEEIGRLLEKSDQSSLFKADIRCPICRDHIIDIARLSAHVADCRRRNAHMGQLKCPYNELHYSQVNEHQAHLEECPDRDSKIDGSQSLRSGGEEARENALIQMVELKLQCGLPVSEAELNLYRRKVSGQAEK